METPALIEVFDVGLYVFVEDETQPCGTPVQKSIKWASQNGISGQKLFIEKILASDVDTAQSSDKKMTWYSKKR